MKLVGILILVVCATLVKSDDMMLKVIEGCKASTGATDEDLQNFLTHKPAETKTQKCLMSCVMTSLGVVSNFL
jgi:hypothetical protein